MLLELGMLIYFILGFLYGKYGLAYKPNQTFILSSLNEIEDMKPL